ncbi:MAG: chemotaxis protein CheX [Synergistaceae bacterium]|nr:chemotaxis protein CheX [Synergistaceae bacterium]
MANDKLAILVNTFGSSLISVGREVGLEVVLNKAQVTQGVKVDNVCAAALIGLVGGGVQGTAVIMLDANGFVNVVTAMSGGMIKPDNNDPTAMSVVGELSNMVSGRSLIQSALHGVDVTPPQLLSGNNIKNVPMQTPGVKCFTLPFAIVPTGTLYLVLSFNAARDA